MADNTENPYLRLDPGIIRAHIVSTTELRPAILTGGNQHPTGFQLKNYGARTIMVRWWGPVPSEEDSLKVLMNTLVHGRYEVTRMNENNIVPHTAKERELSAKRRNRTVLMVQKPKMSKATPRVQGRRKRTRSGQASSGN